MKLLIQPGQGIAEILEAIDRAETSVDVAIFRCDYTEVEQSLSNAAGRGVAVHALIAHVNGSNAEALRKLEMRLLAAGVTVARTDTTLARYHSKYLIVDKRELFVLAFNFTHQDVERSRSFAIVTKNRDMVQQAVALFEADTKRQPYKAGAASFVVSPVNARKQLSAFLKAAKSEIAIYDPRVSDPAILSILRDRLKANVSVRVIGRVSDKAPEVPVRHLAKMRLHTRAIIRDRKAVFLGSQSLRTLELDGRREVGIIAREPAIVAAMLAVFEEDWTASELSAAAVQNAVPIHAVAKKVAKAVATELPPIAPVLDGLVKELAAGTDMKLAAEDLEEPIRDAVKDAVKSVVAEVIQQNTKGSLDPNE